MLMAQRLAYDFHMVENLTSKTFNFYIYQDSQKFVWISSIDGLNRFDGKETVHYLPNQQNNLLSPQINSSFFEDVNTGAIWFSSPTNIQKYHPEGNTFEDSTPQMLGSDYVVLTLDTISDMLWFRDEDSLYVSPIVDLKNRKKLDVLPMNRATNMGQFGTVKVLVGANDTEGVHIRKYDVADSLIFEVDLDTTRIGTPNRAFAESPSSIWIGTAGGLLHYDIVKDSIYSIPLVFEGATIKNIGLLRSFDAQTLVIQAAGKGIFFFDKIRQQISAEICYRKFGKLVSFNKGVENVYIDSDKNLWVSVDGEEVYFSSLTNRKFDVLFPEKGMVNFLSEDKRGRIWIATGDTLFIQSEKSRRLEKIPLNERVFALYHDAANHTWIGTNRSLLLVRDASLDNLKVESLHNDGVYHFCPLSDGSVLADASNSTLKLATPWSPAKDTLFEEVAELASFYAVLEANDRLYAFEEQKNIQVLKQDEQARWVEDTIIDFSAYPNDVKADKKEDKIWLATDSGLSELQAGRNLVKHNKLPNFSAKALLQDEQGLLWISSNKGLWRYNPTTYQYQHYTEADGLQSMDFQFQSVLETSKGAFLFGGTQGVNSFYPKKINTLQTPARPTITNILVNDTDSLERKEKMGDIANVSLLRHIKLPKRRNTLQFNFAALEYSDPENTVFEYQLRGVDKEFVRTTSNFARYPNLRHGDYAFNLRAYNSDGILSDNRSLKVTILPRWYETLWAKAIGVLIVAFITYLIYRERLKGIKRKEEIKRLAAERRQAEAERKQAEAEKRQAQAEALRAEAEKLKAQVEEQRVKAQKKLDNLRLQMNPHFIFNALVSIKGYIRKDPDTARHFADQFSKVMRKVLDLSDEAYNYIADEVALLKEYIEVEALRMEHKLAYHFDYAPELDDAMLPTMLLQPFVENAILHGIKAKGGDGLIQIRFRVMGEQLLCEVEDNGLGLQKKRTAGHESKATSITEQRLALLEEEYGIPTDLKIINMKDENPEYSGVKVQIILPLIE